MSSPGSSGNTTTQIFLLLLTPVGSVRVASKPYQACTGVTQSDTNPKLATTTKRTHSPLLSLS
ncbi:hypothetical protein PF002_g31461 [Phytophthora fragariae]|uniref:RxLR effector protein n=1 Tax=Phytophthora fragariae TaxID=53985 RepID=A0A6A3PFG4_9STRA|nr:hypothetical protein PF003_g14743 [Phytophthora fragariae]KAE8917503.1 hypothetical protein PF009_g32175 [Phytophthora fragariae]KAE9059281.1 hypothetical protein PF007_g31005 [Phytophthora fragariae]KAE9164996.1 hypothetical protein PF002_g31461 [Phytophthora fragariae]KAE9270622.1 hypothetical protein PF008_g30567 [Phytophthora fragariae]